MEQYRMFYTGRWIVFAVVVRFLFKVYNKLTEKTEEEENQTNSKEQGTSS